MNKKIEFLYLNEQDTIDAGVLDAHMCVDNAEEVFRLLGEGDYLMGSATQNAHGMGLIFPEESPFPNMPLAGPDRRFFSMVAYLGGRFDVCGNKWYGSNAENKNKGLPRSVLTVTLNDKDTGEPICFMSANLLSAARTGAVPGVAARHLVNKDAETVAVIGCGAINKACYHSIVSQMPGLKKVVCYDIFRKAGEEFLKNSVREYGIDGVVTENLREALADADIITFAASRIEPVFFEKEWIKKGATLIVSGPIHTTEEFWQSTNLIFDHVPFQENYVTEAKASGDKEGYYAGVIGGPIYMLIDEGKLPPLESFPNFGDIILGKCEGRKSHDDIVTFITCGMAVFDVGLAYELYCNAQERGLGEKLLLWDEPYQG